MPITAEMMPKELQDLQKEIQKFHPELAKELNAEPLDLGEYLAKVGAHCSVLLDGIYTPSQILQLCKILRSRLYEMRSLVIQLH